MIFVVRDQVTFHLRGIHTAVRLRHIDNRQVERRKYIDRHSHISENRAKDYGDNSHQYRDRTAQCYIDQPHTTYSFEYWQSLPAAEKALNPHALWLRKGERATP